jgi:hypothetical protein
VLQSQRTQFAISPCIVPADYSSPYTQPRSAPNKIGYDINPQAYYNPYQPTGTCQYTFSD